MTYDTTVRQVNDHEWGSLRDGKVPEPLGSGSGHETPVSGSVIKDWAFVSFIFQITMTLKDLLSEQMTHGRGPTLQQ